MADKRNLPDLKNRGLFSDRVKFNPREKAFAEEWEKENVDCRGVNYGFGVLQDLFLELKGPSRLYGFTTRAKINHRDRFIVATVIQWLGSNCGMSFLHAALRKCGYKIVPEDSYQESMRMAHRYRYTQTAPSEPGLWWYWEREYEAPRPYLVSNSGGDFFVMGIGTNVAELHGWWAKGEAPPIPVELRLSPGQ